MPVRKAFRGVRRNRVCRLDGCDQKVESGNAYCPAHSRTPEAVQFRRELQSAGAYVELAAEALDPDQVERAEAFHRFRARAKHGEFDHLLEAPTRRVLEQAAAVQGFQLEIGALRYGLMRVLAEETDPARLAIALARLSNATVRAHLANADVEADRAADQEADWLDRVSEAMLGYTLTGQDFDRSRVALRAQRRQAEVASRWDEARRIRANRQTAADAAETERRRRYAALCGRMGWPVPNEDTPGGDLPTDHLTPPARPTPVASLRPLAAEPPPTEPFPRECHDADVEARIAEERSTALRRWEADQASRVTGRDADPEPSERRLARGGR